MTTSIDEQETPTCPICGEEVTVETVESEKGEVVKVTRGHALQQQELDCPDCLERAGIHSKMGTKRYDCKRCNRYAQRLIRAAARRLQDEHPDHYEALRKEAEVELYLEDVT